MKIKIILPAILLIVILSALVLAFLFKTGKTSPSFVSTSFQLMEFKSFAKTVQKAYQVPGMAIAIVEDGKVVLDEGFGKRNIKGQPVTSSTLFPINALTKTFTAALLALEVQEGKFTWSTPVLELDQYFKLHNPQTTRALQVKDLIAGNSGLPANSLNVMRRFGYSDSHMLSVLHFVRSKHPFPADFSPQPALLAESKKILEMESGLGYRKFLSQGLLKPLQMNGTMLRTSQRLQRDPNLAQLFRWYGGGAYRYHFKNYPYTKTSPYLSQAWALSPGIANDGIYSTAFDMSKWLLFNLGPGEVNGNRLISLKNMRFLHAPQVVVQTSWRGKIPKHYGQGWFLDEKTYAPYTVLFQSSARLGSEALMAIVPKAKVGIVILTNQDRAEPAKKLLRRFLNLTFGHKKQPLTKIGHWGVGNGIGPACLSVRDQSALVGRYWNPVYGVVQVNLKNSTLQLHFGPQQTAWSLFQCFGFYAHWSNPNGMKIPMLPRLLTSVSFNKLGTRMTVQYLNQDGAGVFKRLAPASIHRVGR